MAGYGQDLEKIYVAAARGFDKICLGGAPLLSLPSPLASLDGESRLVMGLKNWFEVV